MRDFIGLNTHTVQFRPELYKPIAKLIRNYHPVDWDLAGDPSNSTTFPKARNGVDWSSLYGDWKKHGFRIEASAMFESIKPDKWTDIPQQALAYGESFSRHFGPSGPNKLIEAIEIGNEPVEFSDEKYRLLFESMAKGIRKGDPEMLVAPCAVAFGSGDKYSKNIEMLKGLDQLYDVLNVHSYAFAEQWPTWRRSYPEDPSINYLGQIQKVIDWRNKNAPGKNIWLTEFGYDASTKTPPNTGDFSKWVDVSDEEQAIYIVRSYLLFAKMGIDRAYLFWFNDEDLPQLHGSSGITRNYRPKPSYYALAHLQEVLGGYAFKRVIRENPSTYFHYRFVKPGTKDTVDVVWKPQGVSEVKMEAFGKSPHLLQRLRLSHGTGRLVHGNTAPQVTVDGTPTFISTKR
jgi:hypothetical protein